jgi:hypothetical protein
MLGIYDDDPKIVAMDEDNYGRKMFIYWGNSLTSDEPSNRSRHIYGLLICQESDKKYVYYYPDYNFILHEENSTRKYRPTESEMIEDIKSFISDEDLNALKLKNDWNKPIDEGKCIKVKISRTSRDSGERLVSNEAKEKVYNTLLSNDSVKGYWEYLTSDDYNRHIYFFRTADEKDNYTNSYVVMFKPDNSYAVSEIKDLWNYQDELKLFKNQNNWNKSVS